MASVAAEPMMPVAAPVSSPAPPAPAGKTWLFGPWLDLLFLSNLVWPLIALAAYLGGHLSTWDNSPVVQSLVFWQIYFISTPHRWITLGLVFLDEDRFQQRPAAFMGIGVFIVLFVTAVTIGTGATLFLVAIDYFWNAWHFAAQHAGIARIYGRTCRPADQSGVVLEKVLLRTFILFAIFRAGMAACAIHCADATITQHTSQFLFGMSLEALHEGITAVDSFCRHWLDWVMLAIPAYLLLRELARYRPAGAGRLAYLASVCGAYTALLVAVHFQHASLLAVALAISLFHAIEYLAIVSWAVIKKHGHSKAGLFAKLAPRWGLALGVFMLVLAISAWSIEQQLFNAWAVVTIAVSFMHYAYDGMIWKARRPAPTLAASLPR